MSGIPPYFFDQLILGEGGLMEVYLVALLGQVVTTSLVDILKQQNPDVFRGKWF